MWLKLAPSMYESLQASYHFQPHDPTTEGFVLVRDAESNVLFTNTALRCPDGHEMMSRRDNLSGESGESGGFQSCDHCGDEITPRAAHVMRCNKCDYDVCFTCSGKAIGSPITVFRRGDRVVLRPRNIVATPWCLGRTEDGLVGTIENDLDQNRLLVTCRDFRSPAPGSHYYTASSLNLFESNTA